MREKFTDAYCEDLVRNTIRAIGDNPDREGLKETPRRVVKSWKEIYSGYEDEITNYIKVFTAKYDEIIAIKNISFFSTCEHHMLPFFGKCHIAYLPNGDSKVLGASKLARLMNVYSRRLQIQEAMTSQIATAIQETIHPAGVAVIVEAQHLCMIARGVHQSEAMMLTSNMLGVFRENDKARSEVLHLLKGDI